MTRKGKKHKDGNRQSREAMTPQAFKHWRKSLGFSQKDAAEALGLKRRVVQYYEKGERDGEPVEIPKTVRLACFALSQGCEDFLGLPPTGEAKPSPTKAPEPESVDA